MWWQMAGWSTVEWRGGNTGHIPYRKEEHITVDFFLGWRIVKLNNFKSLFHLFSLRDFNRWICISSLNTLLWFCPFWEGSAPPSTCTFLNAFFYLRNQKELMAQVSKNTVSLHVVCLQSICKSFWRGTSEIIKVNTNMNFWRGTLQQ